MTISNQPLNVERTPIAELKLDPRNPRQHSGRQIKQIAQSIKSFGFNVPVLIDGNNKILAGHGRVLAAQSLGLADVPFIRLVHLTEAQARAFGIADNRLTEQATWDDRLLGEIFDDLAALNLDFSLEATGFSMAEIDIRIESLSNQTIEPDRDGEKLQIKTVPVSKYGDVWELGAHRICCGNSLEKSSYERLMDGEKAAVVFADPPYNVRINGHATGSGAIKHREFAMASGEMSRDEFIEFLSTSFQLLAQHSTDGSLHYLCMDWAHADEILTAGRSAYSKLSNICVWVKSNGGMGSLYRSRHELIFVFKSGYAKHRNNIELGRYGRNRTNVWEYCSPHGFGRSGEEGNLLAIHPTVKPVQLIADALLDCSQRNDIVLDSFLGSGSTLIAAERTGRICRGIEIDPIYVDAAIRRWQLHAGSAAIHCGSGKRFDELAIENSDG